MKITGLLDGTLKTKSTCFGIFLLENLISDLRIQTSEGMIINKINSNLPDNAIKLILSRTCIQIGLTSSVFSQWASQSGYLGTGNLRVIITVVVLTTNYWILSFLYSNHELVSQFNEAYPTFVYLHKKDSPHQTLSKYWSSRGWANRIQILVQLVIILLYN